MDLSKICFIAALALGALFALGALASFIMRHTQYADILPPVVMDAVMPVPLGWAMLIHVHWIPLRQWYATAFFTLAGLSLLVVGLPISAFRLGAWLNYSLSRMDWREEYDRQPGEVWEPPQ